MVKLRLLSLVITAFCIFLLMFPRVSLSAEEVTVISKTDKELNTTLETLNSILEIKQNLKKARDKLQRQLKSSVSDAEKEYFHEKIAEISEKLLSIDSSFEEIATNTDLSALKGAEEKKFNLEEEIISLIKPTLEEMNHMTKDVRKKSELREELAEYENKQKYITEAIEHTEKLLSKVKNKKSLKTALQKTINYWKQQDSFIKSQHQSATLQLKKLTDSEVSFAESTQSYFKQFFQQRGFYLLQSIIVISIILFLSHFSRCFLKRFVKGFDRRHRSFRMRLFDLLHRLITLILILVGPMLVFYLAEDWVLFTLSILLLIGVAWALRTAIPHYWSQIQLFLNIGAVREGERVFLDGIAWRVGIINIFSTLENPIAGIKQRIPIKDLVHLKSRPYDKSEPWFPCSKGDWVILSDGFRGKVIGISQELIKLVQRGGAHRTYLTSEFLALSPLNLSVDFRIKETIGITYDLQSTSTHKIPDILKQAIQKRIDEEGYGKDLLNLRVEFQQANTSSLDLVVIADFKGHLGDLYNRIRRAIQRWCVDACTENNWEIPFTQITLNEQKD